MSPSHRHHQRTTSVDKVKWLEDALKRRILKNLEGKPRTKENLAEAALEAYTAYAGDKFNVEIDPDDPNKVNVSLDVGVHRIWK